MSDDKQPRPETTAGSRVVSAASPGHLAPAPAGPTSSVVAAGGNREPTFTGDKIVFYCPNGHRIEVDGAWAGKRGACSKQGCGAPVVIPIPPGFQPTGGASAPELGPTAPVSAWDFGSGSPPPHPDPGLASEAAAWAVDLDTIDHETAKLVAVLWRERANGGVVEVHLAGGSVIMPQWYDPLWSRGDYALFAAPGPDNTVTLTAVAWNQVQKVVVRQLQYVPEDMFLG